MYFIYLFKKYLSSLFWYYGNIFLMKISCVVLLIYGI